jgi:hypothetical protein
MLFDIAHSGNSEKELYNFLTKKKQIKRREKDIASIIHQLEILEEDIGEFGFQHIVNKTDDIAKIKGHGKNLYRIKIPLDSNTYRILCRPHYNTLVLLTIFKKKRGKILKEHISLSANMFEDYKEKYETK